MAARLRLLVVLGLVLATVGAACAADPAGPNLAAPATSPEPTAGNWKPWVLSSPAEVWVPPPPEAGSSGAVAEERERGNLSVHRTTEQTDIVAAWDGAGEPVSAPWTRMAMELVSGRPDDPPAAARAYALVAVAAYDAMVAAWHYKYRYNRAPPGPATPPGGVRPDPSYPSEHAAIAGAASRVLAYLFPERPAPAFDAAAGEAAESRVWAGANWRSDTTAGLALGQQVADRVIAYARADRSDEPCDRPPPGERPQIWAPTASTGAAAAPVQPCAGEWKPWVLSSGSQFRPPPPPAFGSPEFTEQAVEIVNLKINLTDERKRQANFWAAGAGTPLPPGLWNEVAIAYLRERKPSEPHAERAMAMANVAMADAGLAAWDAKYAYWDPRPENAVQDLGLAGWTPFLGTTPSSPSYISAPGAYAGAILEVFPWVFPDSEGLVRDRAVQASDAQVWGGVEWGLSRSVGRDVGTQVAGLVIERARADGAPPPRPPVKR